jgi:hypothetical protein
MSLNHICDTYNSLSNDNGDIFFCSFDNYVVELTI